MRVPVYRLRLTSFLVLTTSLLVGMNAVPTKLAAQQAVEHLDQAPSDSLNKDLPRWLRFSGEYRARVEGFTAGSFKPRNDDSYFLNRIRLNMKIQPADWLKLVVQGQDARVWGRDQHPAAPPYQDTLNLRLGYLELGDPEKGRLALRVGRQELNLGEQRLVGSADWLNVPRSFDAVRATVRVSALRLDAFASSVVNPRDGSFDRSTPGNNLLGLYGTLEKLVPAATVEPYLFWRRALNLPTETNTRGKLNFGTLGFRWAGKLPAHFDYGTELAHQSGRLGGDRIDAWAGHWAVGYTVVRAWAAPRLVAEFNHASGDDNPHDGRRGTFDQLYPTNHDRYGVIDQVGWENLNHVRSGIELRPHPKWLAVANYHSFWLANSHDGFYNASGALVARVANGSAGRHVGQETDLQGVYTPSDAIRIGAGLGHLFAGTFLKNATSGGAYTYPFVYVNYRF